MFVVVVVVVSAVGLEITGTAVGLAAEAEIGD